MQKIVDPRARGFIKYVRTYRLANGKTIIKGTPVLKKTAIQKNESKKKSGNIGLIVVGAVLPLLLLVFLVSALLYFRAKKHKRREQMRKELSSTALKFCEEKRTTRLARMNSDEQQLISESQSPPPVEIKLAKSFRLFQKHGKCDQTDRLNQEKGNSNFPTYVEVSASPDQAALYKVSSTFLSLLSHLFPKEFCVFSDIRTAGAMGTRLTFQCAYWECQRFSV